MSFPDSNVNGNGSGANASTALPAAEFVSGGTATFQQYGPTSTGPPGIGQGPFDQNGRMRTSPEASPAPSEAGDVPSSGKRGRGDGVRFDIGESDFEQEHEKKLTE